MPEVSITDAKRHFYKIIRRVMQGEVFVITRWGKPVARLVPVDDREVSVPLLREG